MFVAYYGEAQTLHSLIFANKKEQGREADRTVEYNKTVELCTNIADALGYQHDLRAHSDVQFTSTVLENDIATLNAGEDDIVIFYYDGHGCNWDDDDWPHMGFLDKQYWETTAYEKIKQAAPKAKLIMCFSSCCNMDSRGKASKSTRNAMIDTKRVKELFTGFDGRLGVKASASIRGQYSISWLNVGAVYGISLRNVLYDVLSPSSTAPLTWKDTFEAVRVETLNNCPEQEPQYALETLLSQPVATTTTTPTASTGLATAKIDRVRASEYMVVNGIKYLSINVKFNTTELSEDGGMLVIYFEHPEGTCLKDTNGKYCDSEGNVVTVSQFGSHKRNAFFSNKLAFIPVSELHSMKSGDELFIKVLVYDYKSGKIIAKSEGNSYHLK